MKVSPVRRAEPRGWPDPYALQRVAQHERSAKLKAAAAEPAEPLQSGVRSTLESHLGYDFSHVRVHSGTASASAARQIGARAYTVGRDIYLGAESRDLTPSARTRLLAHEAIHTIQQGSRSVAASDLTLGHSGDAAEKQAEALADSVVTTPSLAPAFQPNPHPIGAAPGITSLSGPRIQRDLTGERKSLEGKFDLNLKTNSNPGGTSGMMGTIQFTPEDNAQDCKKLRLLQVVKFVDLTTNADLVWPGGEANRNKMRSSANQATAVEGGFFVDHSAAAATPRTAKADPAVSPYYRDYWANPAHSQDGSKAGKNVVPASLWDSPGSSAKRSISFETAAMSADNGYVYATLQWGFKLEDPVKGSVTGEYAKARVMQSSTFDAAVAAFNKFYKNPGASTAP